MRTHSNHSQYGIFIFIATIAIQLPTHAQKPLPVAPPLPDVPPARRLTLQQAVTLGLAHNPQGDVARYSVESAHGNLVSQRAPINPTINYGGINNTVAPLDPRNSANYSIAATVETSGRVFHRADQARAQFHQAEADSETTRLTLRQSIEDAYINTQVANAA